MFSNVGGRQIIKEVTFNKIHGDLIRELLEKNGKACTFTMDVSAGYFKIQRGGGHNYTIHPDDFEAVIKFISNSDNE